MAITIRNSEVEELIQRIGARTGEAPEAVIARALEKLERQDDGKAEEEFNKRFAALMERAPPRDPDLSWKDIEDEMNSIF